MVPELKKNILATLAYYDIFDFPLKAEEIFARLIVFKHLNSSEVSKPCSYVEIKKELDQLFIEQIVSCVDGYYFLFDREYLLPLRLKREKIAARKWHMARRTVRWLRLIPYVRAIFASGSLAMNNTDELSDLDVLVVTKYDRIWLNRFLILGTLFLLGMRRRGTDRIAPDKICTNHFVTERSLNIPFKSIYNAQTYANLIPIYLKNAEIVSEFMKENGWVLDYSYYWNIKNCIETKRRLTSNLSGTCEIILNTKFGDWLEYSAQKYQSKRIANNPATHQAGGRVVFNNLQLEFHPHSIEARTVLAYNERLNSLGLSEFAIEKDSGLTR
ncbi:MAG: hypothetical protein HYT61_02395 [Candidatus Yanofskybacteria bacterium]|nr:hypothetical protein [Candidatus Yanofskybacteria bacterium]